MDFPTYKYETQKHAEGFQFVAGCDEVGMGSLAGPVVAATVILNPESTNGARSKSKWWYRVRDSKTTKESERADLVLFIQDNCLDSAAGIVDPVMIDKINIHQAAMLAMKNSVENLTQQPDFLFLDGIYTIKDLKLKQETVISGDAKILSIAAASILAKVTRDQMMLSLHRMFPQYGFDKHKGYGTKLHREALIKFGACPEHRKTFGIVQQHPEKIQAL